VFPGGRIDPSDYAGVPDDTIAAARRAAVREAREEAGLIIPEEALVLLSRWITPEGLPKRFDTWFFVAPAAADAVRVDGEEIHAHRWIGLHDALAAQRAGEIDLPPPTFVTILGLTRYGCVGDVLSALSLAAPETFAPRLGSAGGGACTLYEGDAAYDGGDPDRPGPRHRLIMLPSGWQYVRSG
jgi:hypothetical protein